MKEFLDRASSAYYEGNPIISDTEFDLLAAHYNYLSVGQRVADGIPHYERMYSLQKCFTLEKAPISLGECISTPKLDGAAISLLYVGGVLTLALTRGDGIKGKDITSRLSQVDWIPQTIEHSSILQVTGEVVAPKSIKNSRNYASGSLGLKDLEEFKVRDLTFIAYDCSDLKSEELWTDKMEVLESFGFLVISNLSSAMQERFPTDGSVYRINNLQKYQDLGFTAHHPRGSFALKEQAEGEITTLKDVIWQVGKSGVVSPVAILEPVEIGGALVGRATLHNIGYIRELGLELGCQVAVIRSGEIIPRIVRRID